MAPQVPPDGRGATAVHADDHEVHTELPPGAQLPAVGRLSLKPLAHVPQEAGRYGPLHVVLRASGGHAEAAGPEAGEL